MSRYAQVNNKEYKNKRNKDDSKNGVFVKSTAMYRKVEEKNSDMFVITQMGDRLDNLAFEYYSDPSLWWFIARVNNLKSKNVEPGLYLRIPIQPDTSIVI